MWGCPWILPDPPLRLHSPPLALEHAPTCCEGPARRWWLQAYPCGTRQRLKHLAALYCAARSPHEPCLMVT